MPENPTQQSPVKAVTPVLDPSGYVYEAVPSNRLEGVEAAIYYKDGSGETLWDAEDYGQINPQITGAGGEYNWDVPMGDWLVKFTKDGYEPADTSGVSAAVDGWLPVPPPQMNIRVGMTATAAPQVDAATAYTDRVLVTFSQYMDIDSVLESFTVTADGEPVAVTVTALDAEYDVEEENQYATRFALVPADGAKLSGDITVAVAGGAKNYAGKTLAKAYTSPALKPTPRPTVINAPERVSIGTYEEVNVPVWLLAGSEGAANVRLTVESLTPALVEAVTASVTINANGEATVKLKGLLPGEGLIRVTEPVSGLSVTVAVDTTESAAAPVVAKRADGTPVHDGDTLPSGTKIYLTSADPDAVIRYTLDDTCPCKSGALIYSDSKPITVTEDTVLRAAAVRDGVYSATIRLELHVESTPAPGPSQGGQPSVNPEPGPEPEPDMTDPHVNGVADLLEADSHIAFMHGDSGLFRPDGSLTRAEAAQIFYNLLKDKNVAGNATFPDVDPQAWYAKAVLTLANLGIIGGCEDGNYQPDRTITRAEFVTIAARFTDCEEAGAVVFPDVSDAHWARRYIGLAAHLGWINGTDGGRFEPDRDISRAEAAKVVNRMLDRKPDTDYIAAHAAELLRFPDITDKHWAWAEVMEAVNAHGHTAKDGQETWTELQ